MARRRHSPTDNDQLGLALTGEGFQGPAEPHGLLSGAYLARHLRESSQFASRAETTAVYELACRLIGEHIPALRQRSEAFTRSTFLDPLLDALGWRRIPEESIPGSIGTRKKPDY